MADVRWSAIYYPEVLAALQQLKRAEFPEHTETDPADPVQALLRLLAGRSHLDAVRLDHAVRELLLPHAQLRSSLAALAALVGYELDPVAPAEVEVLADLTGPLASPTTIVAAGTLVATQTGTEVYEGPEEAVVAGATGAWLLAQDDGGTVTAVTAPTGTLWGGTATAGDALYFGHAELQFSGLGLTLAGAHTAVTGARWEYYDDLRSGQPDAVTDLGSTIRLGVASVVGATRADGLEVEVTCVTTGATETCTVSWVGGANVVVTSGLLGQSSTSTSVADYVVATSWPELPDLDDGTSGLQSAGDVTWSLPQTTDRRWALSEVGGVEAHWVRVRVVSVTSGAEPGVTALADAADGVWSVLWSAVQGRTVTEVVGATDGSASQAFTLSAGPFLSLDAVAVGTATWTRVSSFLEAGSSDDVYTLREAPDGSYRPTFGDGVRGAIPPSLQSVSVTLRVGGASSGNVDALSIVRDRTGNGRIGNIRNPRAAAGWAPAEGSTPASLEALRLAIPAAVRARDVVVTPADAEAEARTYRTAAGAQVAERAFALEAGAGPGSLALVCVGSGGAAPTAAQLAELDTHLNGVRAGLQRVGGLVIAGLEVESSAYTPKAVAVTCTVQVLSAYASGAQARIEAALKRVLSPTARRQILVDGAWVESTGYQWGLGDDVARAVLLAAIVTATSGVANVTLATPAADVVLAARELPVAGAIAVTVEVI